MTHSPYGPPPARRDVRAHAPVPAVASLAPVGLRVLAYVVDLVVAAVPAAVVYALVVVPALQQGRPSAGALLLPSAAALVVAVGQWLAESFTGATAGGAVVGIRTVAVATGRPAGLGRVLLRQLVVGVSSLACFVGQWVVVASAAFDHGLYMQGWHDRAAGTYVVRASALREPTHQPASAWAGALERTLGPAPVPDPGPAPVSPADERPEHADAPEQPSAVAPDAAAPSLIDVPPEVRPLAGPTSPDVAVITGFSLTHAGLPEPAAQPQADEAPASVEAVPPARLTGAARFAAAAAARGADDPALDDRAAGGAGAGEPVAPAAGPDLGDLEFTRHRDLAPKTGALRLPVPPPAEVVRTVRLAFDTGERVDVAGDGLVGRSPDGEPGIRHLVAIDDPARSVSKVHLAFGLEPGGTAVWFSDRGSTNGTVVVAPDGAAAGLPAGVRAVLEPGWTVRFGERALRVELA